MQKSNYSMIQLGGTMINNQRIMTITQDLEEELKKLLALSESFQTKPTDEDIKSMKEEIILMRGSLRNLMCYLNSIRIWRKKDD